ncbi:MAG: hypothetical protein JWN75_976 [Candidatus Saccharibacteria bacterium]|nr:hypothetical protein [Candidatus Saccharibacteria bacterium]
METIQVNVLKKFDDINYIVELIISDILIKGVRVCLKGRGGTPWITMPSFMTKSGYTKAVIIANDSDLNTLVRDECVRVIAEYNKNPHQNNDEDYDAASIARALQALPYN